MTLTDNDIKFLQALARTADNNRQHDKKLSMTTSIGLVSEELLKIFEIDKHSSGAWIFGVYVEFEPMFKNNPAKEWQK